jgi:hypothetical protein
LYNTSAAFFFFFFLERIEDSGTVQRQLTAERGGRGKSTKMMKMNWKMKIEMKNKKPKQIITGTSILFF